jgi:hypothetical protein
MTAVNRFEFTEHMPKIPVKLYEGTLTRYDVMGVDGKMQDDVGVYSAPVVKGDLVRIKTHTTNGLILMEKAAAGDDKDWAHGIVVDNPIGEDNATASSGTPAAAYQRTCTVALFAQGVITLTVSATGAVSPGDSLALDENEDNEVQVLTQYASVGIASNGGWVSLGYGAAGYTIPVAIGMSCAGPAD